MRINFQYKARRGRDGCAYNTHVSMFPEERRLYVCKSPYINNYCINVVSKSELEEMIDSCRRNGWLITDTREEK